MFVIPTLSELRDLILTSLSAGFDSGIDENTKAALNVLADTQAGQIKQLYLAAAEVQKNIFIDTCDEETLLRYGQERLGRLPFPAAAGVYVVTITGTIGATIPARTTFKSDDDSKSPGVIYILDNAYTLVSGSDTITLRCLTLGEDGKLEVGDTLTSTTPIFNVDKSAEVFSETTQPLSTETIAEYRAKILASLRLEAQGGAVGDYRIWSADAQGVQRVYPYATPAETSEIDLYVESKIADSSDGKGTPTAQTLLDVEAVVEENPDTTIDVNERGRRPINVTVNVLQVTIEEVAITITGFQNLSAQDQSDLLLAFQNALANVRPFIAGADAVSEKNDVIDTNKMIGIIITEKPGAVFASVTFTVNAVVKTSHTFSAGNIPYVNTTITFN